MLKKSRELSFILFYSCLTFGTYLLAIGLSFFFPLLRKQMKGRPGAIKAYKQGQALRKESQLTDSLDRECILFYCSSAGEFEQICPLIHRLEAHSDYSPIVVFHSISGLTFAKKRHVSTPHCLSVPDIPFFWWLFLKGLQPKIAVLGRYEVWPGFAHIMKGFGPLFLVNASADRRTDWGRRRACWKRRWLRWLWSPIESIYAISEKDQNFFQNLLPETPVKVAPDTKFDRAIERVKISEAETAHWTTLLDRALGRNPRLIGGSVWQEDVEILLNAYKILRQTLTSAGRPLPKLILAPHDLGLVSVFFEKARQYKLEVSLLCNLEKSKSYQHINVVIADQMGCLAELYGACQLAFVGGSFGRKVHNVLEPLAHGIPVSCGPDYKNSHEACLLVEKGLLRSIPTALDLARWWMDEDLQKQAEGPSSPPKSHQHSLHTFTGGADIIFKDIIQILNTEKQIC